MMPVDDKKPVLEIDQLTIGYKTGGNVTPVLQNINLKLFAGELVCMIGPNGVGKSTLLRTISGIQKPLSGYVKIGGADLRKMSQLERSKMISVVLTEKVSAGNLNVYELVALGRFPYTSWAGSLTNNDLEHIEWALEISGADELRDRKLYQLSDGQLQKVMISRALAQDGAIVILDEPTAFLDVNNKISIMQMLKRLSVTTKKAILISTHDIDLALQVSDKLWLSQYQMPVVSGTPEDLILQGTLGDIFKQENIHFDIEVGKFKIQQHFNKMISVSGSGAAKLWTVHALEREGFQIVENQNSEVIIQEVDGKYEWIVDHLHYKPKFYSIEQLLEFCKATF